jgi:hypothetical protein
MASSPNLVDSYRESGNPAGIGAARGVGSGGSQRTSSCRRPSHGWSPPSGGGDLGSVGMDRPG